jgi:hypothetical protein
MLEEDKEMMTKQEHLKPGDMVSIDQYISAAPGRLLKSKGKELKKDKYCGGTLFVDHESAKRYLQVIKCLSEQKKWRYQSGSSSGWQRKKEYESRGIMAIMYLSIHKNFG